MNGRFAPGWYRSATVRGRPRRTLDEDREAGLRVFPEHLVPHLRHEGLADLGADARQALLAQHFYQYMLFTTHLETKVVNRGAALVAHGEIDVDLTPEARLDAFKIYCDEGYHALFSLDVVQQVEKALAVPVLPYDFAPRLARLERTAERFLPGLDSLGRLLQVVAFETVVTRYLAQIPRDETVFRVVREVVGDHVSDEVHHHAYFVRLFRELWASLSPALRVRVACSMPHFIDDCLRPDLAPVRAALLSAGVAPGTADAVVADCYREDVLTAGVRESGRHTLKLCESVGAFDIPEAREQAHLLGLLP
ncbi:MULTISPECIES: diiron oxygenase [unclassified Streptomyces]|uniref:diiron oxygenase n=1 Tax=unclassified Streptomyces TaxID=2593676 RepID=UPI0027419844|nr:MULTISPECIES: diiron oxygenase [unclassified Streptomyces]